MRLQAGLRMGGGKFIERAQYNLRKQHTGRAVLADGSETLFGVYEATVLWDGHPRLISIYELDAEPLVGISLMYGYELVLPIFDGATFTLRLIATP